MIQNPFFFAVLTTLVSQGDTYTIMDYLKVGGGIFLAGLTIYRIGDLKMILYVVFIAAVVVGSVLIIPQHSSRAAPLRPWSWILSTSYPPLLINIWEVDQ